MLTQAATGIAGTLGTYVCPKGIAQPASITKSGILRVTRSLRLGFPPGTPKGQIWNYMLTYPFQVAPGLAGISCNIKPSFGPGQDFENGTDIMLFSDRLKVDTSQAIPVTRNEESRNPNAEGKPALLVKYPDPVGFVPLGAKRQDGAVHPHAGTGFGTARASAWPLDDSELVETPERRGRKTFEGRQYYMYWELFQFKYDGRSFQVTSRERFAPDKLIPEWVMSCPALTNAIPDGDDLLTAMSGGRPGRPHGAGVVRWKRISTIWRPVSFQLVTGEEGASGTKELTEKGHGTQLEGAIEPSLIRDLDGELLLGARGRRNTGHPIRVWKSSNQGRDWKLVIFCGGISSAPVTLNRAADGTPYIAANRYQYQTHLKGMPSIPYFVGPDGKPRPDGGTREALVLWPLNQQRNALEIPIIARDCLAELGPPPHGTLWSVDHPSAMTVQLADQQWHNLMGYRIFEKEENTHFVDPTPYTGAYLEEVISAGKALPMWNF